MRPGMPYRSSLESRTNVAHHIAGNFYVHKYRQNVVFVRQGLVDCVMEMENMIRCFAALSEAELRDIRDIVVL